MKKIIERIKALDKGTSIRTLALIVTIINQVIAFISHSSVWYLGLSLAALIITAIIAWWENNDVTPSAQLATKVLNALQDGKITEDEVKGLIEKK
jgi:SPP1 family holin